jgi:hypothetical protein
MVVERDREVEAKEAEKNREPFSNTTVVQHSYSEQYAVSEPLGQKF